jgi:hypothetical protein
MRLICWEGVERWLCGRIPKQLGEVGASVREVDLGSPKVAVEVQPGFGYCTHAGLGSFARGLLSLQVRLEVHYGPDCRIGIGRGRRRSITRSSRGRMWRLEESNSLLCAFITGSSDGQILGQRLIIREDG